MSERHCSLENTAAYDVELVIPSTICLQLEESSGRALSICFGVARFIFDKSRPLNFLSMDCYAKELNTRAFSLKSPK
jgi:hypothetical protein